MDDAAALGIGLSFLAVVFAVALFVMIFPYWRICSKAGLSGAMSLLLLVPVVNIGFIFYLALAEWPIERRLRDLEARLNPYGYPPQPYTAAPYPTAQYPGQHPTQPYPQQPSPPQQNQAQPSPTQPYPPQYPPKP